MNFFKFNWPSKSKPKARFCYEPLGDLKDLEQNGTIPNESDYDLGTPSMVRREDILLVASSSSNKKALEVSIKWRPHKDFNLVTVISKITLVVGGLEKPVTYEFDQVETYEPQVSSFRPGKILQYGSAGSALKFTIGSPYRRMRVVFRGQMREKGSPDNIVFVKFNFMLSPAGKIYDFKVQYEEECLLAQLSNGSLEAIRDLMLFDSHEQPVRLVGETTINKVKDDNNFLWGFVDRQFPDESKSQMQTKQIRAYFNNGQLFHLVANTIGSDRVSFGYTSFQIYSATNPLKIPATVDWNQIEEYTKAFQLSVATQDSSLNACEARILSPTEKFYNIKTDNIPGWAHLTIQNGYSDSTELKKTIERNLKSYLEAKVDGLLAQSMSLEEIKNEPLFVGLREPVCTCSALVGAKASSLAQLSSFMDKCTEKYQVPNGLVLTKYAHDLLLDQNPTIKAQQDKLEALLAEGCCEPALLRQECERLQKLVDESQLPDDIRARLAAALESKLGKGLNEICFAVRSSSWGEDEEDMSAAGQLSTLLNVKGLDELSKAVMTCLASKFAYTCVEYRRQHGLAIDLPMAVVVQEMVACEKAGVMFTCDPTNGDNSLLAITANYGLGESVVSGQAEPDSIRVRLETNGELRVETTEIGAKKIVLGVAEENNLDRGKCCLEEEEILKLAKLGRAMVDFYRGPRDIEWGYKQGQLYLFQSRPVTGVDSFSDIELLHENDKPGKAENEFTTRANIGEVMPFAIKPITVTSIINFWNILGYRLNSKHNKMMEYSPQCSEEVYYDSYHTLFNLRCSSLIPLDSKAGESSSGRAMQVGFFGREIGFQPDIAEASKGIPRSSNLFEKAQFDIEILSLKQFPMAITMREKKTMADLRKDIRSLKLASRYQENKLLGLLKQLNCSLSYGSKAWRNHIILIVVGNYSNMMLLGFLSKYISEPVPLFSALNKLLALSPNVLSAQIPARIETMADIIKAKGAEEVGSFLQMSMEDSIRFLKQSDPELSKLYKEFMDIFGHRCYNEFEIAAKSWRDEPEKVIDMLKSNCKSTNKLEIKRPSTTDEVLDSLGIDISFKDRFILKYILVPKCQTMVTVRERTKDILIEHADILKEATSMLSEELHRQMRIPDKDLIYYFCFDELASIVREPQPALVAHASRRRAMFRKFFREPWKFDEIIRGYELKPNHMLPTRELDEKLASAPRLYGTPASSGQVQAKICLIRDYTELDRVRPGDILLTHSTDIAFSPVFPLVVGIITEVGGLISHGAVVAREYGLPAVLGIPNVTRILQDGEEIILNADNGTIIRLSKEAAAS